MNAATGLISGFKDDAKSVGGLRLHYWTGGDPNGPPVLLWHSFLSTGMAWRGEKSLPFLRMPVARS
jgi:hypothetical protein